MPNIIRYKKVIAVEGKDEVNFFDALMKYQGIDNYQIFDVAGKNQFKEKLPALVIQTGFSNVEIFAVIRDADEDANAAFESIRSILVKQQLKPPKQMNQFSDGNPEIGIFIMPGNSDKGMLEDLCLKTVRNHYTMSCINDFIDCLSKLDEPPKNVSKAKAHAFLAAMPEIVTGVGLAAKKGYWNFDADSLADLKMFINKFK